MWGLGVNLKPQSDLSLLDYGIVAGTVLGMVAEALANMTAARALDPACDEGKTRAWAYYSKVLFGFFCAYECMCVAFGLRPSYLLQPIMLTAVAFLSLLPGCYRGCTKDGNGATDVEARAAWRLVTVSILLNLVGAATMGSMSNDCDGMNCVTEFLPWEDSPCRFVKAKPQGSTCPLPEAFNHAAVMHVVCIVACRFSVAGLTRLVNSDATGLRKSS